MEGYGEEEKNLSLKGFFFLPGNMSNFTLLLLAVHFAGESHEDGKDEGENDCTGEQCEVFHAEENEIDGIADGENNTHCESGADFADEGFGVHCNHEDDDGSTDDVSCGEADTLTESESHQIEENGCTGGDEVLQNVDVDFGNGFSDEQGCKKDDQKQSCIIETAFDLLISVCGQVEIYADFVRF